MDNVGQRLGEKLYGLNSQLPTKEEIRSLIICNFFFDNYCGSDIDTELKKCVCEVDIILSTKIKMTSCALANDHKYRYEWEYYLNDNFNQKASVDASRSIENNIVISDAIDKMFRDSLRSGKISCYLKYASMLVCTQQYEKAESILNEVHITPDMVEFSWFLDNFLKLGEHVKFAKSNSPLDIMKDCLGKIVTQVSFWREESHCLPKHLVYEMYRRTTDANKSEYSKLINERWKGAAVIHARPFMFYLKYLSSRDTNIKQESVLNIVQYLEDKFIGRDNFDSHIETTLNILGHICELENNISAAWTTYAISLLYVPMNNAALWHLFRLLGQQVYSIQGYTP
ncbi:hypothetical protein DPMN_102917 [Dreissena polymorpha]|uniref:Uncharacterized protein n=1 Tax=Dreissena polymorpha TaxID=45954 RepID=A0A9D4H559_DREPO|nr:hypothetical protein DPMN_102917 [Dreissena polymorpha]